MPLVSLDKVHLTFAGEIILAGVDLQVERGDRLVIIGRHGAGKTSLLDLIKGDLQPDAGSVTRMRDARVGYMRQLSDLNEASSVFDAVLAGRAELLKMRTRLARLRDEAEGGDPRLVAELGTLQERYEREGGDDVERRATLALESVGFDSSQHHQAVGLLSGGERSRLTLAQILIMDADLLLLDEPTNHLDIRATEFLERFLEGFAGAVVVVSHDRAFFDRFASRLVALEPGGSLVGYPGSYGAYRKIRTVRQPEELDELEPVDIPAQEQEATGLRFQEVEHSGKVVFNVKHLRLRPGGQTLLEDVSFQVGRGERIGVIGPTGCGKTTLLRTLAGKIEPETGKLYQGYNALIGFYDQELSSLTTGRSVLEELSAHRGDLSEQALRDMAGHFLFSGDAVQRPVESFSGGEQSRLALALLVMGRHNVLLLDEPTNHLDLPSREVLEAALAGFPGTVIAVSHDRAFLDGVADRILSFEGRGLVDEPGTYSKLRTAGKIMLDVPTKPDVGNLARKQKKRDAHEARRQAERALESRSKRLEELEQLVQEQETAIEALVLRMADPAMALDWEGLERLSAEKKTLEQAHEDCLAEWDRLQEESDN